MNVEHWFLIIGMMLVTFPVRWLPLALVDRLTLPQWVREALEFVPIAALTAIIAPIIFLDQRQEVDISWGNLGLIAATVAWAVGYWRKNLLLTIVVGLSVFTFLKIVVAVE